MGASLRALRSEGLSAIRSSEATRWATRDGVNLLDLFEGRTEKLDRDALCWRFGPQFAIRQGDWKLRWQFKPYGKADWELFNLAADPAERKDVAAEHPDKLRALVALWDSYVRTSNVVLPSRSTFETLEDQLPPRTPDDAGYPPLIYKRQFVPPKDLLADPKP